MTAGDRVDRSRVGEAPDPERRCHPDVVNRGFSDPPGCSCDGYYFCQHDDSGCPYHVEPKRTLYDRLSAAWRAFVVGRWR